MHSKRAGTDVEEESLARRRFLECNSGKRGLTRKLLLYRIATPPPLSSDVFESKIE